MSITHDEFWHLPAGVRAWQGDFAVDRLNPPVSRFLAALPLVLSGLRLEPADDASALGIQFVASHADFQQWYVWGRCFHLAWTVATGVLIYGWALKQFGLAAARLSLLCLLACPNVLAHGSIVTPDAAAMFGFVVTSWCLAQWGSYPTWQRAVFAGVALGFLQGIKFTGVVFGPIVLLVGAWTIYRGVSVNGQSARRGKVFGQLATILIVSLFVLAACYGFQGFGRPLGQYALQSESLRGWQQRLTPLAALPIPLPADYLLGVDQQRFVMEQQHPIFLDGQWRVSGFLDYYPKAVLYKLSHGFQLLMALGLVAAWRFRRRGFTPAALSWWGPVAILFTLATFSNMQLGIRYVLPIVPLGALLAGHATRFLEPVSVPARRFLAIVTALVLISALRHHPHHLAYFNEYAGGPIGGRYHLLDSNLDWGQDLLRARDFIQAHADETPQFLYFGTVSPKQVGAAAPFPPSRAPQPGLYLISVNFVMGRPHAVWTPDENRRSLDFQEFGYFRDFEPIGHAGYSIDIYRITTDDIRQAVLRGRTP
ncbi:MAG: glycosyltransferase family 39 protein [Planctomycetaceae bacterium]